MVIYDYHPPYFIFISLLLAAFSRRIKYSSNFSAGRHKMAMGTLEENQPHQMME